MANEAGGKDNITSMVVRVDGAAPVSSRRMPTERRALSLNQFTLFCDLLFRNRPRSAGGQGTHPDAGEYVVRKVRR